MHRWLAIAVICTAIVVVLPPPPALGCSCAMIDPAEMLEEAPAAFVGVLVERPTDPLPGGEFTGVYVFEVETWVKGDLGPTVGIHSALGGAACGFELAVGERAGVFVYNVDGRPSGGLCSTTSADALLAADRPLVFDGSGPPVFLIAAPSGRARLALLDPRGRLISAIGGDAAVWSQSVCPGSDRLVEISEGEIVVRRTDTLDVIDRRQPPPEGSTEQAWCLDPEADQILVQTWRPDFSGADYSILGEERIVYSGDPYLVEVGSGRLVTVTRPVGGSTEIIELATGNRLEIPLNQAPGRILVRGDRLVVAEWAPSDPSSGVITAYHLETGEPLFESESLDTIELLGWVDDNRVLVGSYPIDGPESVLTVDLRDGSIREIPTIGWEFHRIGNSLVTVFDGALYLMDLKSEPVRVATLPTPAHRLLAVLDPDQEVSAPAPTTVTTKPAGTSPEAAPTPGKGASPWPAVAALAGLAAITGAGVALRRNRSASGR